MDGEPIGMAASALDGHLSRCPDCAAWAAEATRLTRMARLGALAVPDLADAITAGIVLPAARVARHRFLLRVGLLLAGVAQVAIGLPAVLGHDVAMAMSTHATHEAAAWNLAIGAAFLAAAALPRRASGLVPLLATFMVVLIGLSIRDFAAGVVSAGRLSTHAAVLIGLLLLIGLDRVERALPPGWPGARSGADDGRGETDVRGVA
jgi:predicted anti-sigma-YlaC factor YlaD